MGKRGRRKRKWKFNFNIDEGGDNDYTLFHFGTRELEAFLYRCPSMDGCVKNAM